MVKFEKNFLKLTLFQAGATLPPKKQRTAVETKILDGIHLLDNLLLPILKKMGDLTTTVSLSL